MTETIAIRTESLSKTFGRGEKAVEAVKDLDLRVESGQVYGFLGPIGAGQAACYAPVGLKTGSIFDGDELAQFGLT